jgi:2,3-bisphosphoglycerate-independent phosphoglycerate mutase
MIPESDTANLAIMSYDPKIYSKGRSPLEAVSMGIDMKPDETAFRCNVVTLDDDPVYENKTIIDHSADEITTPEADELIKALDREFGSPDIKFHTGVSYRHCLIWKNAPDFNDFMRPHDILTQKITQYLPPEPFLHIMKRSYDILKNHPVNLKRIANGKRPANSAWLWSPGKKPALPSFKDKWNLNGSVISAVDLIKGIGICAGMKPVSVEGATGNIHTNYDGKAQAAIAELENGADFVYLHVEAPDECGHRAEIQNKVLSIELIDAKIVKPIYEYLQSQREPYKLLILPDHPTPVSKRTHTSEPVPFMIYSSYEKKNGVGKFDEDNCIAADFYVENGYNLLGYLVK